jgi:hypothetical protein
MTLNRVGGTVMPLVLILGVCATGCFVVKKKAAQDSSADQEPPGTKINVFNRIPVGQQMVSEADLQQLGLFYKAAAQPPGSLDELGIKQEAPKLYQKIADKQIVVFWKANENNAPAGAGNTVLAYDADVLTKKSGVLMLNGTVTLMEPEAFKKAPKAGQ